MAETMTDIRKQSTTELKKLLREKRDALQKFRFSITGTKVRDVKEGQNLRRDVARILTELNQRERREQNV